LPRPCVADGSTHAQRAEFHFRRREHPRPARVSPEVGDRLEVRSQATRQPHELDVASSLGLKASAGLESVEVAECRLSMRPYRTASCAERDARAEQRSRRAERAGLGLPEDPHQDRRQPFDWTFCCGGFSWSLHFEPNPRDVRQWQVFRDGRHGCARVSNGPGEPCTGDEPGARQAALGLRPNHSERREGRHEADRGQLPLLADRRRPARANARSKPVGQDMVLNVSKVASISPTGVPAVGQKPPAMKDRFTLG
jgi:hypothetical protein